jgi:phage terminase large subunit-like protein
MEMRVREAMHQPSKEVDVKTKNFNIWCMSANGWLSPDYMKNVYHKVDISRLENETVYIGIDLSSTRDLTAQALMFPPNPYRDYYPDKYIFTTQVWIPKYALKYSPNKHLYEWWIDSGQA